MTVKITPNPSADAVEEATNTATVTCHSLSLDREKQSVTFGPFRRGHDESDLDNLLKTLKRMDETFPRQLTAADSYYNVEGFLGWFDAQYEDEDSLYNEYPDFTGEFEDYAAIAAIAKKYGARADMWPRKPLTNYETPAFYTGYTIAYYDRSGQLQGTKVAL